MIRHRKASERGRTSLAWLDGAHSFSFNRYYDPAWMGFRSLRVINDDRIAPGGGFGAHPHDNMEILTWITEGALAHKDSMGNGSTITAGQMQRMTAGTGITHSEFNASKSVPAALLQIWIEPAQENLPPSWEERSFAQAAAQPGLVPLATGEANGVKPSDSIPAPFVIHQDADVYHGRLAAGQEITRLLRPGRGAWIQMISGAVTLNGSLRLGSGDGAAIEDEAAITLRAVDGQEDAVFLLFDLA